MNELRDPSPTTRWAEARAASQLAGVRALLEGHAACQAALYASDAETLRELRRLATSVEPGAGPRFHVLLAVAAGNQALAEMLGDVIGQLVAIGGDQAVCGGTATACRDHQGMLDAVLGGSRPAALGAARAHAAAAHAGFLDTVAVIDRPLALLGA